MKRQFNAIDYKEDTYPPIKQQKLNNINIEPISYPIKAVILGNENDKIPIQNNSQKSSQHIPHIYASLNQKQQGKIRNCNTQNFKSLNIYSTTKHQQNIHLNIHWMNVSKLLYSEMITRKYYKPFNSILNGSSLLIYYVDIRDINIEIIRNSNYNPKKVESKNKLNKAWKYFALNNLIFSMSICKLLSPKQLFIIFNGLQNYQIIEEIMRRKHIMQENYAENKNNKTTSEISTNHSIKEDEVMIFRNKWLIEAKDYIQTVLFSNCGWDKNKVKFLTIPILNDMKKQVENQNILRTFYQDNIFDNVIIPRKINKYYSKKLINVKNNMNENLQIVVVEHFIQKKTRNMVLIGYICKGCVGISQRCNVYPLKQTFNVLSIQQLDGKSLKYATIGQSVGICTNIQINEGSYNVPKIITDLYNDNVKECGVDFTHCYVKGVFYWNKKLDSDFELNIGKQLLLQCGNQRSNTTIVGIQISYKTCPALKSIHFGFIHSLSLGKYVNDRNKNYNSKIMLCVEQLIISYMYKTTDDYYCDDNSVVFIKPSTTKINVCFKPLFDLTGVVMDATSKPYNQFTLLSDTQIVAKGKILRLTQ